MAESKILNNDWKYVGGAWSTGSIAIPAGAQEICLRTQCLDDKRGIIIIPTIVLEGSDRIFGNPCMNTTGNYFAVEWKANTSRAYLFRATTEGTSRVGECATYMWYR